jgi:hypothetical protein
MITDLIVGGSIALVGMFAVAWALSARLRAWIEQPKYHFQDALREYDRAEQQRRNAS